MFATRTETLELSPTIAAILRLNFNAMTPLDTLVELRKAYPMPMSKRAAYDIGTGMDKEKAKAKHLAELRAALGLGSST